MKWGWARGDRGGGPGHADPGSEAVLDASENEFSLDELREFMEGDLLEVSADYGFKERLRRKLWDMVRARARRRIVEQ